MAKEIKEFGSEPTTPEPIVTKEEPTTPEPTTPKEEPKVSEKELELQRQIDELKELVKAVADKSRLTRYEESTKTKEKPQCSVSTFNGKIVLSWSNLLTNKVVKHGNMPHTFDQTTELTFIDDSTEVVDYTIWQRDKQLRKAVVDSTTIKGDDVVFDVTTEDGVSFPINVKFIN